MSKKGVDRRRRFRRSNFERLGRVQQACEDVFDSTQDDCSKFVESVASAVGKTLSGRADDIVDEIQLSPWTFIGNDLAAAKRASELASEGELVVGGLSSDELGDAHGHVVVVVPGPLVNECYPLAYWGSITPGQSAKRRGVNYAFRHPLCDTVRYGWIKLS